MRSLFFKIFIWFWLSMVLVGTLFTISAFVLSSDSLIVRGRDNVLNSIDRVGRLTANLHENERWRGLELFAAKVQNESGSKLFLYSDAGKLLYGKQSPAGADRLVGKVLKERKSKFKFFGKQPLVAKLITSKGENTYVILAALPQQRFYNTLTLSSPESLRMFAAVVVSGLVCFFLARHITAPVSRLQLVAGRISRGSFGERVVPLLGNRRDEIYDLGLKFDEMADKIETLISAREQLLRNVSHELRSPLTRLNIALELARMKTSPEAHNALSRIDREVENMNHLIGQIITLSRFEVIDTPLELKTINLGDVLSAVKNDAELEGSQQNCRLILHKEHEVTVCGNYNLLHSTIDNLVRNGLRYTAENSSVEMILTCTDDDQSKRAEVRIRDHGPGVPENDLENLFLPFFQVQDTLKPHTNTSGLGLAIAKSAVDRHDGTIKAFNASGGGLEVIMHIPMSKKGTDPCMGC